MNLPQTPPISPESFAEERLAFRHLAERFAEKTLAGLAGQFEYPGEASLDQVLGALNEAGFFSVNLPVAYGGMGMSACLLADIAEPLSRVDAGIAAILFAHTAALEILRLAADENPQTGNDVYQQITNETECLLAFPAYASPHDNITLLVSGDDCRLTGHVPFLVLGGIARHAIVPARTSASGWDYFLVDLKQPEVVRSAPILTLGLHAAQAIDVDLNNVPAIRLGAKITVESGTRLYRRMCDSLAIVQMAMARGLMEGAFKTACEYASQRIQGGRTIADWPAVRMKLAEMGVALGVAQHCLQGSMTAALAHDSEFATGALATASHVTALACQVAAEGMQVLGGNGYMKDYQQEKRLRDARQLRTLLGIDSLKKLDFITTILEG